MDRLLDASCHLMGGGGLPRLPSGNCCSQGGDSKVSACHGGTGAPPMASLLPMPMPMCLCLRACVQDDPELDAIRQRRMAEMMRQQVSTRGVGAC